MPNVIGTAPRSIGGGFQQPLHLFLGHSTKENKPTHPNAVALARQKWRWLFGFALASIAFAPTTARADFTLSFNPSNTFTGTAPAGSLFATFSDVSGGVKLVLTSMLASGENLDPGKAFYFNINPAKSLSSLSFALTANTGFSQASTVMTGADMFKADGDGFYDILFEYLPSTKAFTTGQSQTYLITTSSGTISAADFFFTSTTGGGNGTWLAAVHVQNTPSGGSGSAFVGGTVPGPSTIVIALSGFAAIGLGAIRRFKRRAVMIAVG